MRAGSRRVELGEGTVSYELTGAGPPLVLLHGAPGDSRVWRPQLDGLADEFTVVAWDAPGCGGSFVPAGEPTLGDYADTLGRFIHALELERPHVLGLSFGGALALAFADRHPDEPRSLVLASAYAGWAGSLPRAVVKERLERALRDSERPARQVAREFCETLFLDSVPAELVDRVAGILAGFQPAGYRAMAVALAAADLRGALPRVAVPTLLLYGDADQRSPPSVAAQLHARIPGARLALIEAVGHMANMEAPDRFNDEVRLSLRAVG